MVPSQPFAGGHLLRPLLEVSRAELAEVAASLPYGWVEDESNQDESYDRNFLRQRLIPQLKARWPAMAQTAARSMALCAEQEALLEELAEADWRLAAAGEALQIAPLLALSATRRNNLLRYWIRRQGRDALPRAARSALAGGGAGTGRRQSQLNWGTQSCRRFQGRLHLVRPGLQPRHEQLTLAVGRR